MYKALFAFAISTLSFSAHAAGIPLRVFGTVSSSTITGINVGDSFLADLDFTPLANAVSECRYMNIDPCGIGGNYIGTFSTLPGVFTGFGGYEQYRATQFPDWKSLYTFSGAVSLRADELLQTGTYSDSRGTLTLTAVNVPEPATWAMMVGGFGMIGAAMRHRSKVAVRLA